MRELLVTVQDLHCSLISSFNCSVMRSDASTTTSRSTSTHPRAIRVSPEVLKSYYRILALPTLAGKGNLKGEMISTRFPSALTPKNPTPSPSPQRGGEHIPLPFREGLGVGSSPVTVSSRDLLLGCFPAKVGRARIFNYGVRPQAVSIGSWGSLNQNHHPLLNHC